MDYLFSKIAKEVTLVHRRSSFRGHLESVDQVNALAKMNKINLITDSEVYEINGEKKLENVVIKDKQNQEFNLQTDFWFPFIWFSSKTRAN